MTKTAGQGSGLARVITAVNPSYRDTVSIGPVRHPYNGVSGELILFVRTGVYRLNFCGSIIGIPQSFARDIAMARKVSPE